MIQRNDLLRALDVPSPTLIQAIAVIAIMSVFAYVGEVKAQTARASLPTLPPRPMSLTLQQPERITFQVMAPPVAVLHPDRSLDIGSSTSAISSGVAIRPALYDPPRRVVFQLDYLNLDTPICLAESGKPERCVTWSDVKALIIERGKEAK